MLGSYEEINLKKNQTASLKARPAVLKSCAGRDSNPYSLTATRPSNVRVCQFRHPRVKRNLYFGLGSTGAGAAGGAGAGAGAARGA